MATGIIQCQIRKSGEFSQETKTLHAELQKMLIQIQKAGLWAGKYVGKTCIQNNMNQGYSVAQRYSKLEEADAN